MFLFSLVRRIKNWGVIYKTARDKKEKCLTKALQFILQTQLFSINPADNRSKNPISYDLTTRFKIAKKKIPQKLCGFRFGAGQFITSGLELSKMAPPRQKSSIAQHNTLRFK